MYAETEFTLDGASKYDKNSGDDDIPGDGGDGDDSTEGSAMSERMPSRFREIRYQV